MSTTKIPAIDDIYANAEKQKKALDDAAQISKDNKAAQIEEDNQGLKQSAEALKQKTEAQYDEIYDANAVNQYISERRVAESMANMGLTDSGLNATQQVALQTSRGNADNRARLQEQAAINDIELQLSQGIAQNQRTLRDFEAQTDAQLKVDNATVDTKATEDANQWVKDYNKSLTDAADERDKQIKAATTAVKNLNSARLDAVSSILSYAEQYDLSENEIRTMCGTAGVDYDTVKKTYGKQFSLIGIKDNPAETTNYESAFKSYNVEQTGRDKLIPALVEKGILTQPDAEHIETLWAEHVIRMKNAIKANNEQQATVQPVGPIVLTAQDQIDGWLAEGAISLNAATYMTALINYHQFGKYMKATNFQ